MMFIYLPDIKNRPGEVYKFNFERELCDLSDDFSEGGMVQLFIEVSHSGTEILIKGIIEATLEATCSRCLQPFTQPVNTGFLESFTVVKGSSDEESPAEQAAETANMLTVSGDYLYLDEYIRQQIILAEEQNPTCKPDCLGICSGCGAELNLFSCQCEDNKSEIDVRLLKLKEYKSGD